MAESLFIEHSDKTTKYQTLLPQIEALVRQESNWIANLANVCAALTMTDLPLPRQAQFHM